MENGSSLMGTVALPANDPGNNGGGSYNGTSTMPSTGDFEDLFGPAGREVKQDPNRHKRHQRWHLPDVLCNLSRWERTHYGQQYFDFARDAAAAVDSVT